MLLILLFSPLAAAQPADLIVANARVYTAQKAAPRAAAIAVRGGRITAVGGDLSAQAGPKTRRIDARGAAILPGFIDSHAHMAGLGASMETLDLRGVASVERIAAMVREAAAGRKPGEWILGRSWDQTNWGGAFPVHQPLTAAVGNIANESVSWMLARRCASSNRQSFAFSVWSGQAG